ncbi:gluconolaconase [Alkalilimnicola ehrlichii]|uniref:Gluconolaconase n=1 Tax=Alkalilimnicola ehrlichii TaxID=351052 RepID=A0A3E0WJH2_9GAMM|nr:SMP-30/gluconolactonase/LRE family protein [Alkalilimnicola ehrlichii]RFA26568.1 gluconolaconase [Alkalilimnicola ehrlichii]RFA32928.1 gluconolaconase [Alkalilimnicola ehrlichii]
MNDNDIKVAAELRMSLGESPLWSVERQTLYWVDINNGYIYSWRPNSGKAPERLELAEKVGCIALCEDGLLAATASGILRLRLPLGGEPERLVANAEWREGGGNRFNDGRCDAAGRLWVGTIAFDEQSPVAALYCFDQGELACRRTNVSISNGLAFSPDQRWLYHTDSLTRRILRYPFDVRSGTTGEPETWVDLAALDLPGVPDGAAVDSEGYYWIALYGGGSIVRFSPKGGLVASYALPCPHPTMVAFGGRDLRTLYITTATQHLDAEGKARWPLAGSLLSMPAPASGLPEPKFSRGASRATQCAK